MLISGSLNKIAFQMKEVLDLECCCDPYPFPAIHCLEDAARSALLYVIKYSPFHLDFCISQIHKSHFQL